jgi:hypothetical protein
MAAMNFLSGRDISTTTGASVVLCNFVKATLLYNVNNIMTQWNLYLNFVEAIFLNNIKSTMALWNPYLTFWGNLFVQCKQHYGSGSLC